MTGKKGMTGIKGMTVIGICPPPIGGSLVGTREPMEGI
jgi:hypothetical protein